MDRLHGTPLLGVILGFYLLMTAGASFGEDADAAKDGAETDTGEGAFVWAPIPLLQPALGGGAVLIGLYFYPHEAGKPANITGAAAGYTSTNSYLIAAGHDHHFDGDRWRFQGVAGYAEFNLNFNGIGAEAGKPGRSLSYSIKGTFVEPRLWRTFSYGWSAGLAAQFLDAEISFDDGEPGDPIFDQVRNEALDLKSIGVGVMAQKDTRDNRFAPYTGQYFQGSGMLFPSSLTNDLDYRIYKAFYNHYWTVRDGTVLAANLTTGYADGQVPFYRLSKLNFRGVSGDTYWDKFLLQGQAEVRQQIHGNWSAALFAGYGGVSSSLKNLGQDDMIFAGGAGIRYMVAPKQRVALRLDVAKGQDETMVYVSVGEAF